MSKRTEPTDIIILKIAHEMPETHPQHTALTQIFAPLVESGSDWKIRVEIYPDQKLGNEAAYMEGVRKGTVEMCIGSQTIAGLLPWLGITELPYLFKDYEHFIEVMNSDIGTELTEGLDELGLVNIGWTTNGFRQVSLTTVHIEGENRVLRIGSDGTEPNRYVLKAMGYNPRTVDMKQLTVAIQQSLVEGHDFPLMTAFYNGWTNNQKYLQVTRHILDYDMYLINNDFWESLDEPERILIMDAAEASANYEAELLLAAEEEIMENFKNTGVPIVEYDPMSIMDDVNAFNLEWIGDDAKLKLLYERILRYRDE